MKIQIYEDASGQYRWRGVEANGRIVVESGEGYVSLDGVRRAIDNVIGEFRGSVDVWARSTMVTRAVMSGMPRDIDTLATYPAVNVLETNDADRSTDAPGR